MTLSSFGADRTILSGHKPALVSKLAALGDVPATNQLYLALGLPLRNRTELDQLIGQIYDPASPNFHQYLTPEEFTARFGPTEQDYQAVVDFARTNGLKIVEAHRDRMLLDVTGAATDVERAFQVKLHTYSHPTESRRFFAPDSEPSVPAQLRVADVQGLSDFSRPRPQLHPQPLTATSGAKANSGSAPGGGGQYFGGDFRAAYVPGTALTGAGQIVGLIQFDGFYSNDITSYETQAGLPAVPIQTNMYDSFNGTPTGANGNAEVSLDIEMVIAMAPGISKLIVYEGNPNNFIPNDVLSAIASDNQAKQISSSWSWTGGPSTTTDSYLTKMIAQGQSVFFASGDSDAYTGANAIDTTTSYTTPITSTNVTAVGGTTLSTSGPGGAWTGETVWNWNNSGQPNVGSCGGISTYYSIPWWQTNMTTTGNNRSTTMRNLPDVALTADNIYVIYNKGTVGTFGGTSCAAPLWAGFTALVNQQAAAASKPPVGFLSPALYSLAASGNYTSLFHDITTGNNIGTNTPGLYYAVAGYDLCTGLGTPNGTNLINALAPISAFVLITNTAWSLLAESASPTNGAIDPGETVTVNFTLQNLGTVATSNLVATLQPSASVLGPGAAQSYGALAPFGGATNRSFTFTSAGSCDSTFSASLQLQDGTNNLGTVTFTLPLGRVNGLPQSFDGVAVPALPSGWTTVNLLGPVSAWGTTNSAADTAPNSAFDPDSASAGENALVSPPFPVIGTNAQLSFRQNFSFEISISGRHNPTTNYYDGGVLEIRLGNGAFTDIISAGGSFVAGGYNNTILGTSDNPLAGHSAWVGNSGGWLTTTVKLPAAAAGQTAQLRWNCATDTGNTGSSGVGWYVDSISITDNVFNCVSVVSDLAVSQSLPPNSLLTGQNLVYTLTVTNAGPQPAANVVVTDTVPANATFVFAPGGTYASGNVTFSVGMMAAGAVTNFSLTLAPASGNVFSNTVTAATLTPEVSLANNTAALVITQASPSAPTITNPPVAQSIQCGSNASFTVGASGTAPLKYQWSLDGIGLTAATNTTLLLTNVHLPNHVVAVIVTNLYGSATSSVLLSVQDTLAPLITLNGANPLFVELGGAYVDPGATAFDLCAGSVPVATNGPVNAGVLSTNTVTYSANDGNGNTNTATRTVIVRDTTPPTISWSFTNLTLAANSNCAAAIPDVTGTNFIRASDLSGALTITQTPTNNAVLPLGTNAIVITVADSSGNKSYSTNRFVVRDQTPPVLVLNGLNFITTELGAAFIDPGVSASDDCSGIALLRTNGTVNVSSVGTNLLTYIAVDGSGNTNTATRTIVVRDTTPPVIVWSFTNRVLALNSNCVATMPDATGTNFIVATDLAGIASIVQSPTNGALLTLGSNVVVLAVADPSGNTTYSTNIVVVQDQTPPIISTQPQSQTVAAGGSANFTVTATACTPLSFQWFFGETALSTQTNSALMLTNLDASAAGNYSVVVTADGGATTSAVAVLTIVSPSTVGIAASENPSGFQDQITFTATVTPGTATGNIEFLTNGTAFDVEPLAAGSATSIALATLPRGTNLVTAIYPGDGNFLPATNSFAQVVTNHPPVVSPAYYSLVAGSSLTMLVADLATNWSDADGDPLFIADISVSTNGIVVTNALPTLFYSNSNYVNDQFVCAISDGFGGTNYQLVNITVVPQTNPTPIISTVPSQPAGLTLQLSGAYDSTYILEGTTDLLFGAWSPIATNTLGVTGVWQFTDFGVTNTPNRFYRLKLVQ